MWREIIGVGMIASVAYAGVGIPEYSIEENTLYINDQELVFPSNIEGKAIGLSDFNGDGLEDVLISIDGTPWIAAGTDSTYMQPELLNRE